MGKKRVLILAALTVPFVLFGLHRWLGPYYVAATTAAMEPTIRFGDRLVVNSIVGEVGRGDLVMFRFPPDPREVRISRVVAVGGDVVQLRGTQVLVNGEPLRERRIFVVHGEEGEILREAETEGGGDYSVYYAKDSRMRAPEGEYAGREPYRVLEGSLFTLGDNRDNSEDSRFCGPVPATNVTGRPMFVYGKQAEGKVSWTYRRLR